MAFVFLFDTNNNPDNHQYKKGKKGISRKEKRKQEREEKKKAKIEKNNQGEKVDEGNIGKSNLKKKEKAHNTAPTKSVKKTVKFDVPEKESGSEDFDDEESESFGEDEYEDLYEDEFDEDEEGDEDEEEEEEAEGENSVEDTWAALKALKEKKQGSNSKEKEKSAPRALTAEETMEALKAKKAGKKRNSSEAELESEKPAPRPIPSHDKQMMAQDEVEMEYYKKRMGLKSMKLSKEDDGLDDILGDLDFDEFAEDEDEEGGGEKGEEDEEKQTINNEEPKVKENPFVAPTSNKYVPPSKRKLETPKTESEETIRLRKQIKGLLNRVSESNISSIVNELDSLYLHHSRSIVNSVITQAIIESIALQGRLNEQFLIVHAALVAALYRTVGLEFGAYFVQTLVENFDKYYQDDASGKEPVNVLALLSQIYTFQVVSCRLIYDFIKMLLDGINEPKTELLLKIVDSSGSQLRSDDPASLKDIIYLLHTEVGKADQSTINTRTKFLIERITDLKNNKQKKNASQIQLETTQRMKKFLGGVSNNGGNSEPLRVSLDDIRNVDKKGKWWLVGAAWNNNNSGGESTNQQPDVDVEAMQDILDTAEPNWMELARQQRMNTDIRRAIFVALMSSEDYVDACERMQKLKLKSKQEREIPRVVLHCCSSEEAYNPFYALVASKLCGQHTLKKTFQFALWDYIGILQGEDDEDGEDKQRPADDENQLKKTMHYAKLYAHIVADGVMTLDILKTIDFLTAVTEVKIFLELFYITLFQILGKRAEQNTDQNTKKIGFGNEMFEVKRNEATLTQLIARTKEQNVLRGTQYFQRFVLSSSTMPKKAKMVERIKWASNVVTRIIDYYVERQI